MISENFSLTTMTEKDLEGVYIVNSISLKVPWSIKGFEEELNNNLSHYIVCKNNNHVVGFGGMWIILDEAHITNIAVHPQYRNLGIASSIIKALKNLCKNKNVNSITLEVRVSNKIAQALYKKEGFLEVGIRKNFYTNPIEDGIIMWNQNF